MTAAPTAQPNLATTEGQTLPHSLEAEQTLLGTLLLNNDMLDQLEGRLLPEHFFHAFHGQVFATIEKLVAKGFEANPLTVSQNLPEKDTLAPGQDVNALLDKLLSQSYMPEDVNSIASIILSTFLQRQLLTVGQELAQEAQRGGDWEGTLEILTNAEGKLFNLAESGQAQRTAQQLRDPLREVIERAEAAKKRDSYLTGVTSGLKDLDKLIGGFQHSDLIILAARPSMGKTALAVNVASNAASALQLQKPGGAGVAVFSLEMSADQLAARMLSSASGIDSNKLQQGNLNEKDFGRLVSVSNELAEMPLFIDDTPQLHINALRGRARRLVRQHNVGLIVVDYLQLMRGNGRGNDFNRVQEISDISQGLKGIARELNVPVIALSQLSRAVESRDNKRPMLSDLRESGSIEQDADIVMFLYREEYYLEKQLGAKPEEGDEKVQQQLERLEKVRGLTELLISKNRKGSTGGVTLQFQPETTTFHDYAGNVKGYEH
jgi:replicative DNA helicase